MAAAFEHDVNRDNNQDSDVGSILLSALTCLKKESEKLGSLNMMLELRGGIVTSVWTWMKLRNLKTQVTLTIFC